MTVLHSKRMQKAARTASPTLENLPAEIRHHSFWPWNMKYYRAWSMHLLSTTSSTYSTENTYYVHVWKQRLVAVLSTMHVLFTSLAWMA